MNHLTPQVRHILSGYAGSSPGVLSHLARMLNHGALAGTGKMMIYPVDQGFEHGPVRSFAKEPLGNDPRTHFRLAQATGCNAHAAPLGALAAGAAEFAGTVPLILKLNNADSLAPNPEPCPAITACVRDALELGCSAVGLTIYPGSAARNTMYQQAREIIAEAKSVGLPSVVWSYPRGGGLSRMGEQAVDIVAYGAHIACQLGAHIVKVKPPTAHIENSEAQKLYAAQKIPIATLTERVRHIIDSSFGGQRIVLFSGGAAKSDEAVLAEVQALADGGSFGSIMGRNLFQRPRQEALALAQQVSAIYRAQSEL